MPSNPSIRVFASPDGVNQIEASKVSQNGYVVNAWFSQQQTKYLRIQITPNMPDTLGGTTYSFGITNLSASLIDYFLYSELVTKPVAFSPVSAQVRFKKPRICSISVKISVNSPGISRRPAALCDASDPLWPPSPNASD